MRRATVPCSDLSRFSALQSLTAGGISALLGLGSWGRRVSLYNLPMHKSDGYWLIAYFNYTHDIITMIPWLSGDPAYYTCSLDVAQQLWGNENKQLLIKPKKLTGGILWVSLLLCRNSIDYPQNLGWKHVFCQRRRVEEAQKSCVARFQHQNVNISSTFIFPSTNLKSLGTHWYYSKRLLFSGRWSIVRDSLERTLFLSPTSKGCHSGWVV